MPSGSAPSLTCPGSSPSLLPSRLYSLDDLRHQNRTGLLTPLYLYAWLCPARHPPLAHTYSSSKSHFNHYTPRQIWCMKPSRYLHNINWNTKFLWNTSCIYLSGSTIPQHAPYFKDTEQLVLPWKHDTLLYLSLCNLWNHSPNIYLLVVNLVKTLSAGIISPRKFR